jgi:predicted transcriptional regulator
MTKPTEQNKSMASLISTLSKMNSELDQALDNREFEAIQELVELRGPVIQELMQAHKLSPIAPREVEKILSFEEKLKTKMRKIQHLLGGELTNSRRHAHAQRMYARFETDDDPLTKK